MGSVGVVRMTAVTLAVLGAATLVPPPVRLDPRVQRIAETALNEGLRAARQRRDGNGNLVRARGGAVVVLDLVRHSAAALASAPEPGGRRWARAVAPGSVVKPFVALGMLGAAIADDRSMYPCPASLAWGGRTLRNWRHEDRPAMTIGGAIVDSCNTVFFGRALEDWRRVPGGESSRTVERTLEGFGFGTPIGVAGSEPGGSVPRRASSATQLMLLTVGQDGLCATPLQVARAYARLAQPALTLAAAASGRGPLVTTRALAVVRAALEEVPRSGTASDAFRGFPLDRVPVAGKTGTAEAYRVQPYAWFAAYAPARRPRYVIVVTVEEGGRGSLTAAPIARRVIEGLLLKEERGASFLSGLIALALALGLARVVIGAREVLDRIRASGRARSRRRPAS